MDKCAQVYILTYLLPLIKRPNPDPSQMHADGCREIQYGALVLRLFVSETKGKEDN